MEEQDVFSYITTEENNWKTARVPLTNSKDWNMREHIERCTNVSNAWFHQGKNDGLRRYDDIVTPIINVAFRSEGFDVKDIIPFVDDVKENYKSFIVKKRHPQWARINQLDTFIDDVVETSVIYDLVIVKNVNNVRPEVIDLKTIAFCDQTDVMAGPLCLKHQYTPAELSTFKSKWNSDRIEEAIVMAKAEKEIGIANDKVIKTPSKYIEVYELRGYLPKFWLDTSAPEGEYEDQIHIVCYYTNQEGEKNGITLYKGKDKPLAKNFKALKIDRIRSKGRACGRSIVESLFETQVWANYDAIKIKELLDSAFNVIISDSEELGNQKLTDLKKNTILKQGKSDNTQILTSNLQNLTAFNNDQAKLTTDARIIGSASEAQLGTNPASGTPFALQNLVVQQGQGIHEYRQGKIATFFADILYPELILKYLVDDLNSGVKFSEELSLDEMLEISDAVATNQIEKQMWEDVFNGKLINKEEKDAQIEFVKEQFKKGGNRKFFEVLKGELADIPVSVMVNVAGKQRYMAQNADKITNILREVMKNPQAFSQIPGVGKAFNQVLEESGLSPIDFSAITQAVPQQVQQQEPQEALKV